MHPRKIVFINDIILDSAREDSMFGLKNLLRFRSDLCIIFRLFCIQNFDWSQSKINK